jgi:hypothetical protein
MTVERFELVLLVVDSFYNVTPGIDLRDKEAEQVVALLKSEIADATGCTVLIVDHMPWATETNRGRLRAYGGVFKNAATRFGIYIDAHASKLTVEARGNNIRGFRSTPARWDAETLMLELLQQPAEEKGEDWRPTYLMEQASRFLEACSEPPSRNVFENAVPSSTRDNRRAAIDYLVEDGYASERPGLRNARLYVSIRPYRQPEDPHFAHLAAPRDDLAGEVPPTTSHTSPSPLQGGEVGWRGANSISDRDLARSGADDDIAF